jgi:hypothetical protein
MLKRHDCVIRGVISRVLKMDGTHFTRVQFPKFHK